MHYNVFEPNSVYLNFPELFIVKTLRVAIPAQKN
jgi:hypothetical protein